MWRYASRAAILGAVATLVAIGLIQSVDNSQRSSTDQVAEPPTISYSYLNVRGLGDLVQQNQSIVRVLIDDIEAPIWNSSDGKPWKGKETIGPDFFSRVKVTVEDVLFGEVPPTPLTLYVKGDARTRYEKKGNPPYASLSGGFIVGAYHLLALQESPFFFEDGHSETHWIAYWEGNWRISGDDAIGADPRFTMKLDVLRQQLAREWAARGAAK